MSTVDRGLHLTPQESLARELIVERVAARHHAARRRQPSRAALLLRTIADRLDHSEAATDRQRTAPGGATAGLEPAVATHPHAGQPRPWSPQARRAPHRHS